MGSKAALILEVGQVGAVWLAFCIVVRSITGNPDLIPALIPCGIIAGMVSFAKFISHCREIEEMNGPEDSKSQQLQEMNNVRERRPLQD